MKDAITDKSVFSDASTMLKHVCIAQSKLIVLNHSFKSKCTVVKDS